LVWRVPGLSPYGSVSRDLISEPVRLKFEGPTPEVDLDEGVAPGTVERPAEFTKSSISLTDLVDAVYSGSRTSPVGRHLPSIPDARWRELRSKLQRLKSSREGQAEIKFGNAMIKPLKISGPRERPAETSPEWARRKLLNLVNSRARLM